MKAISHKKLLLVEGEDEVNLFGVLLEDMKITDVEVIEVGGKHKFKTEINVIVKTRRFSDVDVLAIIRDADDCAKAAFESIKGILEKLNKEKLIETHWKGKSSCGKPQIEVFIMPGNSNTGMLEDLCLKTVKNHTAMRCVETFANCVSKLKEPPTNMAKTKAQAFLSAMPKLVNSVGLGAKKHYWNFESNEMIDIKSFIKDKISGTGEK